MQRKGKLDKSNKSESGLSKPNIKPQSAWKEYIGGIDETDEELSGYSMREIAEIAHARKQAIPLFLASNKDRESYQVPEWALQQRESIERGQQLFLQNIDSFLTALIRVLLNGFVIARFSEVLILSGYAHSPRISFLRFRATALHIWMWMNYSLFDPS